MHAFAGIGLGDGDVDTLCKRVRGNRNAYKRWTKAKSLIIDEVSMISGELFDKLEEIARRLRPNFSQVPFGGIQVGIRL